MKLYRERSCGMYDPLGIESKVPDFAWNIEAENKEDYQKSYRVKVFEEKSQKNVWDSGVVESRRTNGIRYEGTPLRAETRYCWSLEIQSVKGDKALSSQNFFETGIAEDGWNGKWIAPEQNTDVVRIQDVPKPKLFEMFGQVEDDKETDDSRVLNPVSYLRKEFELKGGVESARLYITALGLYEASINGEKLGDSYLNPGFEPYDKILEYQTYDVTETLQKKNCLQISLADGWYKGRYGVLGFGGNYGTRLQTLYELVVTYKDGSQERISSDESTKCAQGPIRYADLLIGEKYDASREMQDGAEWKSCEGTGYQHPKIQGRCAGPVKILKRLPVKEIIQTPNGETVLDFGQDLFGFVEMKVSGSRGTEVKLEHAEVLDKNGNFIHNVSGFNRDQTDIYVLSGEGEETWHPTFTGHGFRYVKISGYPGTVEKENFRALVLGSVCEQTGTFSCSDRRLNQLQSNIEWSQRSNFVSIPTDCPQRERAGWTGDVAIYCDTASYNTDTLAFYKRWLQFVRAEQYENGLVPIVVPWAWGYRYLQMDMFGSDTSAGWGDVMMELPWKLYQIYDEKEILEENFDAMKAWMQYVEKQAKNGLPEGFPEDADNEERERQKYLWNTDFHFGDWLFPSCKNEAGETDMFGSAARTKELVATALYARSAKTMAEVSEILGEKGTAAYYTELNQKIRKAFSEEYIDQDGRVKNHLQGLYVLTLAMKMVEPDKEYKVAEQLARLIEENGYRLDTGFMSIKYLLDVLVEYGYEEHAKRILYNPQCPGWMYEINHGATTIWETWDAIRTDGVPTKVSYNHYSFGCVGDWMYRTLLGIQRMENGYRSFRIQPNFHFDLESAEGSLQTVNGFIEFSWKRITDGTCVYHLNVPGNTTAEVVFPGLTEQWVEVNGEITSSRKNTERSWINLGSGDYEIRFLCHTER